MKKNKVIKNKKQLLAALSCLVIAIALVVLPMISAYGEDEPDTYASISVNIHGENPPATPGADALAKEAKEKVAAETKAAYKKAEEPATGTGTRNIVLWISLGLTAAVVIFAAVSIKTMEK